MENKENEITVCSICKLEFFGFGNNAYPINDGRCCDDCDMYVIAERIRDTKSRMNQPRGK